MNNANKVFPSTKLINAVILPIIDILYMFFALAIERSV
jgi:hypothetical protein